MGRAFATHKAEHICGQGERPVRAQIFLCVSVDEVLEDMSDAQASGRAVAQRSLGRRGGEGQRGMCPAGTSRLNTASGRKPPRRYRPFPLSRTVEVERA
jgi:hypothetical protein